jgi:hypothetical protein
VHTIRIVAAGIVLALIFVAGSVAAQTSDQAGQPPKLLAGLRPPHETKAHDSKISLHAKTAHKASHATAAKLAAKKRAMKTKLVSKQHGGNTSAQFEQAPAQTTPAAPLSYAQPAAAPADVTQTPPAADDAPQQSAVTIEGQTVQVEPPDQINELDLAAGDTKVTPATAAPSDRADAVPAAQTALAAPMHRDSNPVGSASWIAQVLAALGGAVAAGGVAWFLIGSGPVRIYG